MCDSLIGAEIANYRILELIGQGGMGCVYRARDQKMGRIVALKVIRHKFGVFSAREGRALGQLSHPNIVSVFHMDDNEAGVFIAMEYIEGRTLTHRKGLPWHETFPLLKESLLALEHAHNKGVIHRDIKPGNIMVTDDRRIKVMDFGLAKVDTGDANRTITRFQAGTINYMSPEQVRGLQHVDHRSDIYSLGKTFYELLAGALPFDTSDSDQYDILKSIIEVKFKPPSHLNPAIPRGVDDIIMKAIEKDPNDRYQTAREMIQAIEAFEKEPVNAPRETLHTRIAPLATGISPNMSKPPQRQKKKNQWLRPLAAGLGITAILAGTIFWWSTLPPSGQSSSQPAATSSERSPVTPDTPITPASLLITTRPEGAILTVNDKLLVGLTPSDTVFLTDESARIQLSKDNYIPLDTTIIIPNGEVRALTLELVEQDALPTDAVPSSADLINTPPPVEAAPVEAITDGTLIVRSNPRGAIVRIDGERIGTTPISSHALPAGQYELTIEANNYETLQESINLRAGSRLTFDQSLTPLQTTLNVLANPYGTIELNGQVVRGEERGWFTQVVPRTRHRIRVTHPAFGVWEKDVDLTTASDSIRINFNHQVRASITTVNDDNQLLNGALIFVDGEPLDFETPTEVQLRVGRRHIEVRKEGFTAVPAYIEQLIEEGDDANQPLVFKFTLSGN